MLAENPRSIAKGLRLKRRQSRTHATSVALPRPETLELLHLARVVLSKSSEDLSAVASASPQTHADWLAEFETEKARADNEAAFWAAAIASLATAPAAGTANDG